MLTVSPWLLAGLLACGGGGASSEAPDEGPERKSVFLPPDEPAPVERVETVVREPSGFVAESSEIVLTLEVEGRPTTHRLEVEQVALRTGDLRTLDHTFGFIKLEPRSWTTDLPRFADIVVERWLRDDDGAPIQVFLELQTVGQLDGQLVEEGDYALAEIVGLVQVDSRQHSVAVPARFTRRADRGLEVTLVEPMVLPLSAFHRDDRTAEVVRRMGWTGAPETVTVQGSLSLVSHDIESLPTFVRTPVTMRTVDEFREEVDAEIDDIEVLRTRAYREGVSEHNRGALTDERFEAMQRGSRTYDGPAGRR